MSPLSSEAVIEQDKTIDVPSGSPAREARAMALAFSANEHLTGGTETILFVEDEAFVREVTGEVLRAAGYSVLMATSASEAMRSYGQHYAGVDMLLTDVILPGVSGRDLAKRLRDENALLKVLLITGYGKEMGLKEKQRAEKCLSKPFSARMLLWTVREVLEDTDFKGGDAVRDHALRR